MTIVCAHVRARCDLYSILLLSCSISSGALGSPDILLSYSIIALALHNTIIHNTNPYINLYNVKSYTGTLVYSLCSLGRLGDAYKGLTHMDSEGQTVEPRTYIALTGNLFRVRISFIFHLSSFLVVASYIYFFYSADILFYVKWRIRNTALIFSRHILYHWHTT